MSKRYEGWRITRVPELPCPLETYGAHTPTAEFVRTGTLNGDGPTIPTKVYCNNCFAPYEFELFYEAEIDD